MMRFSTQAKSSNGTPSSSPNAGPSQLTPTDARHNRSSSILRRMFPQFTRQRRTVFHAIATVPLVSVGIVHQNCQGGVSLVSTLIRPTEIHSTEDEQSFPTETVAVVVSDNTLSMLPMAQEPSVATGSLEVESEVLAALYPTASQPRLTVFPQNIAIPTLSTVLPLPGDGFKDTTQLAYCCNLLRMYVSPSSAAAVIHTPLDRTQHVMIESYAESKREVSRIRWLTQGVVDEFAADSLKSTEVLSEVLLLAPYLDEEYYRKLLSCVIDKFEASTLLDIDLLQGLVQLVESASPEYLEAEDLVRIFAVLCTCWHGSDQQPSNHLYYLAQASSRLIDVMVNGMAKDMRRAADYEPLAALLDQMKDSSDPYLRHQVNYAFQGLLYIPNDEMRRQSVLRHADNITMGLLGVASVCQLDQLNDETESREADTEVVGGVEILPESDQDALEGVQSRVGSGGRLLWYIALREAHEHIRNGRLRDFNHLIFEAPCCDHVEFQWGICRMLGEIAVDPLWEGATCQYAVDLLSQLYKNDAIRPPNEGIDKWILNILRQIGDSAVTTVSHYAQSTLQNLEKEGDVGRQEIYRGFLECPVSSCPIKICMPVPSSSELLAKVMAIPAIESDLLNLKIRRLIQPGNPVYIPPQAKPTLQSADKTLFPLMEKALDFLNGSGLVFLLLGDSGGGKSTFNRQLERTLWKAYKRGDPIPLHINLPSIDNPQQDLIAKQLRRLDFTDYEIQELKQSRQFIVICDGYDESQLKKNIYTTNELNSPGQWKVKVVISCRTQYLGQDYRSFFQPTTESRYDGPAIALFQEAAIAKFYRPQILQYVEQYVKELSTRGSPQGQPLWPVHGYMNALINIPNLLDMSSNPFLLALTLDALPNVIGTRENLATISISRVQLYDSFVERWLKVNKRRLLESQLCMDKQRVLDLLLEDGFLDNGLRFQKDLAAAIFLKNAGHPVIKYTHLRDGTTWKAAFFSPDEPIKMLRESSTVNRSGTYFRFLHRSLLEYFYSRTIYDPREHAVDATFAGDASYIDLKANLARMSIIDEPSILRFLAERVEMDPTFKERLLAIVVDSKTDAETGQVAANAMTILVKAGVRFNGVDLRRIRIPGADLRGGQFDSANLEGADLSGVNMSNTWLRQADLRKAVMTRAQFGELPYLELDGPVLMCVFSSDGQYFAASTTLDTINIFATATWERIAQHPGGLAIAFSPTSKELAMGKGLKDCASTVHLSNILTGVPRLVLAGHTDRVNSVAYSPDGAQIASASEDHTVRIWSTESGDPLRIFTGHTKAANTVAFSPASFQLASCSDDGTIRTWDLEKGEPLLVLEGHRVSVNSITYSPDGHSIGSGGWDHSARLWDANTGEIQNMRFGYSAPVAGLAFSPNGLQVASYGFDGRVHLWDPKTGESISILTGHSFEVGCAAYSPAGDCIASGGSDKTVRLWTLEGNVIRDTVGSDALPTVAVDISPDGNQIVTSNVGGLRLWETLTGRLTAILRGHINHTGTVKFSPCGQRLVSASWDKTVRIWCIKTGSVLHVLEGHDGPVEGAVFSPTDHEVASTGADKTVRTWDSQTGEKRSILEGHTGIVRGIVYSPNGHQMASWSMDGSVRLWNPMTKTHILTLNHPVPIIQAIFWPGREDLILIALDAEASCWNTQSGERSNRISTFGFKLRTCSFSPGGELMATCDTDGMLRLWNTGSGAGASGDDGRLEEVCHMTTGVVVHIRWARIADYQVLATIMSSQCLNVWKLVEDRGTYKLQLLWAMGCTELSLEAAKVDEVVGLSLVNSLLLKQRGAVGEVASE
ncbi:WD_REPEATS_REGION domain-containing protein [Mortierella hygrophila]|uniref:WD_REPEATS_REGION domain-containing protein n=1 Tax=Mortierella hygrophila TaxID=979708 RepID=A0A9P6JYH8_9FUNG|nr:WD_REPEATS_REGION domain-containing protein [Mortierella hygrophila]